MKRDTDGFVLVAVIWVLAILTVLAIGFGRRALLDQRAAALSIDRTRTQYLARGAVEYGIAHMRNQAMLQSIAEQYGGEAPSGIHGVRKNLLEEDGIFDLGDPSQQSSDDVSFAVEECEGRISLNSTPREVFDAIEGLSFTTVTAILRRRDEEVPQPFLTAEEARFVDGITDQSWYGTPDRPGLRDLFTVHGDGRINVNAAPREVLEALPDMDPSFVALIISYRAGSDGKLDTSDDRRFRNVEDVATATGIDMNDLAPLARFCKFESQFFTITGTATQRQGKVRSASTAVVQVDGATARVLNWWEGDLGS
ncbi:MAG: general secretion pathway protein GspK [Candidatus Hydrogenedentes bacterium]|nr:general secretion pathway protein GspK [Candidatus Hydrogenedentota bacterium]